MDTASFVEKFLTGQSLQRVIGHFCRSSHGAVADPITNVLHTMIASPVCIMLTQVGISFFKANPSLVYPYKLMTQDQKDFVGAFVTEIRDNAAGTVASLQIGGGCVLGGVGSSETSLSSVDVLGAGCRSICCSRTHTDPNTRRAICNIVVQRVGALIHVSRAQLQEIMKVIDDCLLVPEA